MDINRRGSFNRLLSRAVRISFRKYFCDHIFAAKCAALRGKGARFGLGFLQCDHIFDPPLKVLYLSVDCGHKPPFFLPGLMG